MAITNFVIEGTVSEITIKNSKNVKFKITGTEGFSIKLGEKKYNIITKDEVIKDSKSDKGTDENFIVTSYVLSQDFLFSISDKEKSSMLSNSLEKRIKFIFEIDEDNITNSNGIEKYLQNPASITVFAD